MNMQDVIDQLINEPALQPVNPNQHYGVIWPPQGAVSPSVSSPVPTPLVQMQPLGLAIQSKVAKLSLELPMRVIGKIKSVDYFQDPPRFVVVFSNNRMVEFCDIDVFPSDEHIARIALEAP